MAATVAFDGAAHFDPARLRMLDRASQFALVAARQAFADANFDWPGVDLGRAGCFVGTGMGGSSSNDEGYQTLYGEGSDRIKPFTVLMGMHNASAAWIAIDFKLRGPSLTYSTACSSSAVAIGEAWLRIASGSLDLAIAGGCRGAARVWLIESLGGIAHAGHDRRQRPVRVMQTVFKRSQRHGAGRRRGNAGARTLEQRCGTRRHHPRRGAWLWVDHGHRPHHPPQRGRTSGGDAGGAAISIP